MKSRRRRRERREGQASRAVAGLALAVGAVVFAAGCADEGRDPLALDNEPAPVSFATEVKPILDANCVGCHGQGGNAGLNLGPGVAWSQLVGVPATTAALLRVTAGDPEQSLLYLKINGQPPSGDAMPPTGVLLPRAQRDLVRRWIAEGAADN